MKSVEDHLNRFQPPDVHVESHRTQLGYRLQRPTPARAPRFSHPVLAGGLCALLLLGGWTAIHPTWAAELLRLVLVREQRLTTTDGKPVTVRTYQSPPGSTATGGSVQLQADASGQITSATTQAAADPALNAMHQEAAALVQSGQAQLFLEQDNMRWYHVTLADGRRIVYTAGPGDNWGISTQQ